MPHLARSKFAVYFRRNVDVELIRNCFGDLTNRYAAAAADIDWQSVELMGFGREQVCPGDVLNERKIACLLTILIKHRRQIVQQPCAENRNYTRIWIEDRLARSVGAGVTQRDGGNAHLLSPKQ